MIRLGPYSGSHLPNVQIRNQKVDWVLEGVAVFLLSVMWGIAYQYYNQLPAEKLNDFWRLMVIATSVTGVLLWAGHFSVGYYRFPVRVDQTNIIVQYCLATRMVKVTNIIHGVGMTGSIYRFVSPDQTLLHRSCLVFSLVLFVLAFIIYYLIARHYRIQ